MDIHPMRGKARILGASMVGTAIEYYDFFIYATAAALVFPTLFFPDYAPATRTLLSWMTFGVAFVARPIGAIAFGHFGDRLGRKSTLVASLLLMGVSTLLIAFLPTYATAGWIAPILLCILRFGQGFGLGGEWSGASLLAIENAPKGWQIRFATVPQLGVPVGLVTANGLFMFLSWQLSDADFLAWGWRIPFLASALLVAVGLWVRLKVAETPQFRAAIEREPPHPVPVWQLLTRNGSAALAGTLGAIATFATFYLATAYALSLATGSLGYDRESFLAVQLVSDVFYAASLAIFAGFADRVGPGKTLAWGAVATAVAGLIFIPGLETGSLPIATLTLAATMFALGMANSPLGCWLSRLYPVRVRYTGVAFAFNIGGVIGGATTPFIAQALNNEGLGAYIGLMLTVSATLTLLGVWLGRPVHTGEEE